MAKVSVTVVGDLQSTAFDETCDDVTYVVIFGVKTDGNITIVSGVIDNATDRITTSNATSYTEGRVYTS